MTTTTDDAAALLEAARQLRPVLAERAHEAELNRRIHDETIEALHDTGLLRAIRPRHADGYGIGMVDLIKISAELSRGCPSTSWLFTVLSGIQPLGLATLGQEGQKDVYGEKGTRTVVCSVLNFNSGTAVPHEDGYLVNGKWGYASGSLHADYMAAGVLLHDEDGQPTEPAIAYFPIPEATVLDTWKVAGMAATGSNTVVAENVFVPARRVGLVSTWQGRVHDPEADPYERFPLWPYFTLGFTGILLGAAEEIFHAVVDDMKKRGVTYFDFPKKTDSAVLVERIGEVRMSIDGAWLHAMRSGQELDELTKKGPLDYKLRARMRADAAQVVKQLRDSVNSLLTIAGAAPFASSNSIQRLWRDLNVASGHSTLNTYGVFEAYGRAYLGLEPNITDQI